MEEFLIYTSLTAWKEPPRSRHQVANSLQAIGKVYFVEQSKIGFPRIDINYIEKNVVIITPFFPVDFRVRYRTPVLNEWYHFWLCNELKKLKVNFRLVFTFDHTSHVINKFFANVIYYCGDDFIGNSDYNFFLINYYHTKIENNLVKGSQLCIVTSSYLFNKHSKNNLNTHLIPLGAPSIKRQSGYKQPLNERPTLGIVAFFNRRIPLDTLGKLLSEFRIIMIGPVEPAIRRQFQLNQNAVFTGTKTGDELYEILEKEVDVCIALYSEEKINKGVTPNKLWLYLALGKPCVVTHIPNIQDWDLGDNVIYKSNNNEFIDTCKKAYEENNEALYSRRLQIAESNSWDNRVNSILKAYYSAELVCEEKPITV